MARYHLRTFGGLSIEGAGAEGLATQRKSLVLLAVVAAHGSRGIPRDRLLTLLWPEANEERARGALKQSLHAIRRQLDAPQVVDGTAELRLDPEVISTDWAALTEAVARGDDDAAVQQYAGPFLDGVFSDGAPELDQWIDRERSRLDRLVAAALEHLAERDESAGDALQAVSRWQRRHDMEPLNARVSTRLMRAMASAGDRAGALQHARVHETRMQSELELPPDPSVVALADALRSEPPSVTTTSAIVRATDAELSGTPVHASAPRQPRVTSRWRAITMGTALLAALVVALLLKQRADATPPVPLLFHRVAVAVFVNRTGTRELDALGTMASDWVTRGLSRTGLAEVFDIGGLYVGGRAADGKPTDPRVLARANGAGLVVAGNYYRTDSSLVFSVQVLDVASGRLLRSLDPITTTVDAPLAGIEEVRQRVASALGTVLDPRVAYVATPAMVPPRLDAYTEFAAAQEVYWRGDWEAALPHFRRAAALDTNFTAAIVAIGVTGVGTGRCYLADSVAAVFAARGNVDAADLIGSQISVARCASDHATHNRLHRERSPLLKGSKWTQMVMSTGFRQLNQPAEALAILSEIRPERDLGWLPIRGRAFFWREVAANEHQLRDYRAERRTANRMRLSDVSRLATDFVRARSLAALGEVDSVLAILDGLRDAPPDPALIAGTIGRLDAMSVAHPGWAMWQIALEFESHGHPAAAREAAERAATWYAPRENEKTPLGTTLMHARVLEYLGRLPEARALLDRLVRADSLSVDVRGSLGVVAARQGDSAVAHVQELWLRQDRGFPNGLPRLYRAGIAAVRGDASRAAVLLDSLPFHVHPTDLLQFHLDPAFAGLRTSGALQRWVVPRGG